MSFSVTIPVANITAANAALQAAGWGPGNFSATIIADYTEVHR